MTDEEKEPILAHAKQLRELITWDVPDEADLIEDRGSQITLSIYGNNGDPAIKKTIDPDFSIRRDMLQQFPFENDTVEVKIGGSTCIDYMKKGKNKGFNVDRLINQMGWDPTDCVYYGDALFPGGNDETVVGVIDTIEVADAEDTLQRLQALLD